MKSDYVPTTPNYTGQNLRHPHIFNELLQIYKYSFKKQKKYCIYIKTKLKRIIVESSSDWLYMQLKMFQRGVLDARNINDPLIHDVKNNGIVTLRFKDASDYFKLFNFHDFDLRILSGFFGNYYGYSPDFMDYYATQTDWREGYIFRYFNEENMNRLIQLKNIVMPQVDLDSNPIDFTDFLTDNFDRDVTRIIDEHNSLSNDAIEAEIKEDILSSMCDSFRDYKIYSASCFRIYYTTVRDLINLFEKMNKKSTNLSGLLKTVVEIENIEHPENFDEWYEYNWGSKFDDDEFNKEVDRSLNNIFEKLEDSDFFTDIEKFKEINTKIKKFGLDKWAIVPKTKHLDQNNQLKFKIVGVDPKTNNVKFEYTKLLQTKGNQIYSKSLDYQNFISFLYNYELF